MGKAELFFLAILALPARSQPEWARDPLAWAKARLGSQVRRERVAARRFLAFRVARALPFLQEALRDRRWRVREGALQVLGWGGGPLPSWGPDRLLRDPSWPVRRNLAWLLGFRGEGRGILKLLAEDSFQDVRAQAAASLAAAGALEGKELLAVLEDRAPQVRNAGLRVLTFSPLPPALPRAPRAGGERAPLERTLWTLSSRPCAGQLPWVEALLRPGPKGAGLGEKLLALQVLRPLGSVRPGDAALVLQGLRSEDPFLRGAAVGTGLLLSGAETAALLPEGLRIPGRDGFEGFLKIAETRKRSLAPLLVPQLDRLLRERRVLLAGTDLLEKGVFLLPEFLRKECRERIARETALRIRLAGGLASAAQAPGLREWLLRVLSGNPDGVLRDRLLPLLLPFAGEERTASFLLSLLPRLPWWRRKALVRALVEKAGGKPVPALLEPLEKGRVRDGTPLAQYLDALRDYPPTRRYHALLRRILAESRDRRARVRAARNLTRRPSALDARDLAALEEAALAEAGGGSIREACLEALAAAGSWTAVERILTSLPEKDALSLERFLARMVRRKGWSDAASILRKWARPSGDARLELEVFLALASLGEEGAWERLLSLSLSAGELAAERISEAFLKAPEEAAKEAFAAWSRPEAPVYLQEAACALAGERPRCGDREVLEGLLFGKGPVQVRAAALAALTAAGSPLPGKLLTDYLEGRKGTFFQGWWEDAFREVLGVLARIRTRPEWTETFLWSALFHPFFQDPLGSLESDQPFWGGRGRARLEEARLLAGVLFCSPEDRIRRSLKGVLARREKCLGRGLLGKRLLLSLLFELARRDRGRRLAGLEGDLAESILQLAPRGGLPDLYASSLLARRAARARRWEEAARRARRACREALVGTVTLREVEVVLGETDPPARSFPLARLAAAPFLYGALSALEAGKKARARRLARRALEAGGADGGIRAKAERILAEAEKRE